MECLIIEYPGNAGQGDCRDVPTAEGMSLYDARNKSAALNRKEGNDLARVTVAVPPRRYAKVIYIIEPINIV
jgi:hypothetical protein